MAYRGLTIRNKNEQIIVDEITKAHKFLNEKLNVNTNLHFGRTAAWGRNVKHRGFYEFETKDVVINFRNLYGHPISIILEILGHEMRHAVQYKTGMLSKFDAKVSSRNDIQTGIWNNKEIRDTYWNLPWEKDARAFQEEYAQLVIDANIIDKQTLNVVLPGKMVKTYLEQDTYNEIKEKHPNCQFFSFYETEESFKIRRNEQDDYIKSLGFELIGEKENDQHWNYIGDENKKSKAIKKVKSLPQMKRRKDPTGFCFLTIEQLPTNFKKWTNKSNQYAWKNLTDLMKEQFVPYKQRLLTIDDFVS